MYLNLSATLLWTNQSTVGTTLTSDGHSDTIDLRQVNAVWLAVAISGVATQLGMGRPNLSVQFEVQDSGGTWFPVQRLSLTAPEDSGRHTAAHRSAGLFLPAGPDSRGQRDHSFAPMVLPEYGRISWTVHGTNPVFRSTVMSLYGR